MSAGESSSKSKSKAGMSQGVFDPEAFDRMYQQASDLWNKSQGNINGINNTANTATANSQGIFDSSNPYWQNQMRGGATAGASAAIDPSLRASLESSLNGPSATGQMYQDIVGGPGNTYIDPMVKAMKTGVMDNLNRFGLTSASDNATAAGQNGSSRQGVEDAILKSDANKQMMQQEADMRGQNYGQDMTWKMGIANMADANKGAAQDRAIGLLNSTNANQQEGLNFGSNMNNLNMATMAPGTQAAMMPWQMMRQYSSAMGGPQVLSNGSSRGSSKGQGSSASMGK